MSTTLPDIAPVGGDDVVESATVVIVGGGLGAVATVVNLAKRGVEDVLVLEASDGVGGTWYDNQYPGAEVDVTSELYSFSFADHVFSRSHVRQPELLEYIRSVAEEHGVLPKMRNKVKVSRVEWRSDLQEYRVVAQDGRTWAARFVVSGVGQLNNPRIPEWPGVDEFRGEIFHTARWNPSVDLTGKRVAVVGTGSTSAQVVPAVARTAAQVTLFQRQAGWTLPKGAYDYSEAEAARLRRSRLLRRYRRAKAFLNLERMRPAARLGSPANRAKEKAAREHLERVVKDPRTRALLTPNHPFYCRRPILSDDFLPAMNRDNVALVPYAVESFTPTGIVDAAGNETPVDVVIAATGFTAEQMLATFDLVGEGGLGIHEFWGKEPRAFLGLMVPKFPNFFMLYGPNTNGGTILYTLERQAEWIARAVARAERRGIRRLDVRPRLFEWMDERIMKAQGEFAWSSGACNSYYPSATGRVVTQWPLTQTAYMVLTRLFGSAVACRASRGGLAVPNREPAETGAAR